MNETTLIPDAGYSTCPLCGRYWLVTLLDDCCLPACGCYGSDTSEANEVRPCSSCGIQHAWKCVLPRAGGPVMDGTTLLDALRRGASPDVDALTQHTEATR